MYIRHRYSVIDILKWTRYEILMFGAYGLLITLLYEIGDLKVLHIPWPLVAVIGTAVAFLISFQNNAAYGRIWEARKIWGGIVNQSRSWAMQVRTLLNSPAHQSDVKIIIHRHVAWLTALRHAMRESRPWETFNRHVVDRQWAQNMFIPERRSALTCELGPYLSAEELERVCQFGNKASAVLYLQSEHIRRLKDDQNGWEFSFLVLQKTLIDLFDLQGRTERIKNFPYPRQYASLGFVLVWAFMLILPFALIPEFASIADKLKAHHPQFASYIIWLSVPSYVIVAWAFHTMERVGRAGENPYEGTANDVPISTISRSIEIELRNLIQEDKDSIPQPFPVHTNTQM